MEYCDRELPNPRRRTTPYAAGAGGLVTTLSPGSSDGSESLGRDDPHRASLRLAISRSFGAVVVTVLGELDVGTSVVLGQSLDDLIEGQGNLFVVVDLREVVVSDAAGLGVLAKARQRMEERDGQFVLASPSTDTDRALRAAGLADVIEAHAERRYHPSVVRRPRSAPDSGG